MKRASWVVVAAVALAVTAGCSHKEQPASGGESGGAAATASAAAATGVPAVAEKLYMTFSFTDIAVTTSAAPVLRLGFQAKNGGSDPVLCEEGSFTLQLADGSVLDPDAGAENRCDPDTIDPGASAKVTVFFDLKKAYSGPVTLIMSDNATVIGRGTAQVH